MGKYHAFFYECDDTVICKKCNWISRRRKDGSTAGVRHHLKTKHQEVFSELEENDRKRRTAMTEKVAQLLEHGGIKRPFDGTTLEEALAQQPLFKQEKRVHVPVRDPDDDKITGLERAVMQMICTAALPSTIVEDPGFLNLDVSLGWDSLYQTLSYFVEIQESLELFLLEHSHYPTLDKKDWEVIKEVVEVLRPIFLAVESLRNQSYTPISVVIPLYKVILGHLGENSTLSQMKEPIREAIQRAMNGCEGCEDLVLATLVDPRFKHVYFEQEKRSLFVEKAAEILVSLDDGQSNGFGEANNSSNPFMSFWMAHKTAVTPVPFNHTARAAAVSISFVFSLIFF
ncbi:hypothetical protein ANCCEY_00712 [Ancylostoma ceylanicum]|uniref:Uncharacterized protein n=1 Tax=Ancylostoma ceylanicum TaxID=53326 RepID=A0A0D6MD72_9BILA|nr:hypothetical protein ANCCEY_00712 [Ancylostoma ceylanicum]